LAASEFDATKEFTGPASFQKVSVGRQVLRRELNDRVSRLNAEEPEFKVLCECGRASCRDGVVFPRSVYDRVRNVPTHFLIKDSHAVPDEQIVDALEGFLIVEKPMPQANGRAD
jgi:hypothetical protein